MFNKKVIIDSLRNLNKPSKTTNRNSFDFNEPDRTEEGFISAQEGVETPIYKAVRVGPSPIEGKGLFAEQAIKKGDVIGVSHIRQNFTKNGEEYRAPFPSTVLGYYNHSEEPNVYEVDKGDHILMVAGRDIPRGQEITSDYSKHNIEDLEVPEDFKKGGATRRPKMPKGKSPRSYSRSFEATNRLFAENPLFAKPKSRKNKIFDPRAQYYAKGGVTEVDPTFECDDDGRCYETDQIQNMLDRGRDIPREVLNTDWDVINQVYPEKGKGISAAIAWKQRGVPTLESRLGPINLANCMWAAGSGWMCEPEFKNVPKTAFESNDKFINAVNKGTIPFTRVTKTTDPYFDFKSKGLLQPGDIINLKGPNTSHAMTFSHYREDGMPIYVDSNGKATDFDWDEGIWPGIKPGNGRTAYISRFNPEMLFGDKIKELEEKARTNPTYVETELTQEDIDKYVKGGYIVEELSKARNGLEVKEIKPIKDTSVPSWKSKLFNRAVIPMGYDMFTVLSAPLEAITPKALKYKPKEFATKNRLDAFRVYNGLEPEFNTFTTNPDGTLAANHFRLAKEDFKKIIDHPKKSFGTTEIADNFNFAGIHGNGWITKGVDNQGRKFIDFTDTWDLNPLRGKKWLPKQVRDFEVSSVTGSKPYDLKNRIYYDDAGNFFDHNGNKLIEEVQHFPKGVVNKHKAVDLPMLSTSDVVGTNQMDVLKDWNNINNHKFVKGVLGAFGLTMWGLNNLNKYLREEEADKESINDDIEIEIPEEDVQKYVDGGLVKKLLRKKKKPVSQPGDWADVKPELIQPGEEAFPLPQNKKGELYYEPIALKDMTQEELDALNKDYELNLLKEQFSGRPGYSYEKVEPQILPYNYPSNTEAAKSWEVQKELFPKSVNSINDWYVNWYKGRINNPKFADVAEKRLMAALYGKTPFVLQAHPKFKKDHDANLAVTYIPKVNDPANKKWENKIVIGNAMFPDDNKYNNYYNSMFSIPEYSNDYFTVEGIHEKSHWDENNFPQEGTSRHLIADDKILSKLMPKGFHNTKGKREIYNDDDGNYNYDFKSGLNSESPAHYYLTAPTEIRARLNVWRKKNNISPTKDYTVDELKAIINQNVEDSKLFNDDDYHNIIELFHIIKGDPNLLKQLNDSFVKNNLQQVDEYAPQMAKYGGQFELGDEVDEATMKQLIKLGYTFEKI